MCTLNSKCNTKVANGLAAKECQFDSPSHNLAWCSFPDEPNSEQVHLFSAPHNNLQDSSQIYLDRPRSQDNTPGRQFSLKLTTTTITVVRHFGKSEVNHKYIINIERNEGTLKIRDTIRNKSEINSEVKIRNIIRGSSEMHHK